MIKMLIEITKKHWGLVLLSVILFLVAAVYFRPGYFIIGNDNFSPELNPSLSTQRYLSEPGYRTYRALGYASDSEAADVYRSAIFTALNPIIPNWLLSQGYYLLALTIGPVFVYLMARRLAQEKSNFTKNCLAFGAGVLYLFSLQTINVFFFTNALFVAAYGFFPMFLYSSWQYLDDNAKSKQSLILFALANVLVATAAITVTVYAVLMFMWGVVMLSLSLKKGQVRERITKFLKLVLTIFVLNAFWLLPLGYYYVNNAAQVVDSYISRAITPNIIASETDFNDLISTVTYKFSWLDTQLEEGVFTFPYREHYGSQVGIISGGSIVVFSLIGGFALALRKRQPVVIALLGLYIFGVVMTAGRAEAIFNGIFYFFVDNVPYFGQIMRWASSKLWPLLIIPVALLAPYGYYYFYRFIVAATGIVVKRSNYLIIAGLLAVPAITTLAPVAHIAAPFFSNALIYDRYYVQIPQEYYALADYLSINDPKGRIYLAPEANTLYFHNHDWSKGGEFTMSEGPGFWGSGFLQFILQNPLVDKTLSIGSAKSEEAQRILAEAFEAEDTRKLANLLSQFKVKYILLDRSQTSGPPGYQYSWERYEDLLQSSAFTKVWGAGQLSLYRVVASEAPGQVTAVEHELRGYSTYSANSGVNNAAILPLALQFENLTKQADTLKGAYTFQGTSGNYQITGLDSLIQNSDLPTKVKIENGQAIFSPAIPQVIVNGVRAISVREAEVEIPSGVTHLLVDGLLVPVRSGTYTLDTPIAGIDEVGFVREHSRPSDWREYFAKKQVSDCKEYKFKAGIKTSGKDVVLPSDRDESCTAVDVRPLKVGEVLTQIELEIEARTPHSLRVCVWSNLREECVNQNDTAVIDAETRNVQIPLDAVTGDDFLVVNLSWQSLNGRSSELKVKELSTSSGAVQRSDFIYPMDNWLEGQTVALQSGSAIKVEIPLISKFDLQQGESGLLPGFAIGGCDLAGVKNTDGALEFRAKFCANSVYKELQLRGYGNYLVFYEGENFSGIPLDVNLREVKFKERNREAYRERITHLGPDVNMDLLMLPEASRKYGLSVVNLGFRTDESRSNLKNLVVAAVPDAWFDLQLKASQADLTTCTQGIGFSAEPGWWSVSAGKQSVVLNSWEQGFVGECGVEARPMHLSNVLGWIGYLITFAGVVIATVVMAKINPIVLTSIKQ